MSQTPRSSGPTFGQAFTRTRRNSVGNENILKSFGAMKIKKADVVKSFTNTQYKSDIHFNQPG